MAYNDLIISRSPVAYWRFEETSGTNATDEVSSTAFVYSGTPTLGANGLLPGYGDKSVLLNGSSQYAQTQSAAVIGNAVNGSPAVTIEAWIKPSQIGSVMAILGAWINASNQAGIYLEVSASGNIGVGGRSQNGDSYQYAAGSTTLVAGQVYHVCGILDFANDSISIYVNGALDVTAAKTFGATSYTQSASTKTDKLATNADANGAFFAGNLDELALYGSALSSSDILANYQAGGLSYASASVPLTLDGTTSSTASALPLRLRNLTDYTAGSIPMSLSGAFSYAASSIPLALSDAAPSALPLSLVGLLSSPAASLPMTLRGVVSQSALPLTLSGTIPSPSALLPVIARNLVPRSAVNLPMRLAHIVAFAAIDVDMLLRGSIPSGPNVLPIRLNSMTETAASAIPMMLQSPDPLHFAANAARWSLSVRIQGDLLTRVVGQVVIDHEESASTRASFSFLPVVGDVDPSRFENQPVVIEYQGLADNGQLLYSLRRFTGITTDAVYDPDAGVMSVQAMADLQGLFEDLPREQIAAMIGGYWSQHVFDEDAEGWEYAEHRLETIPFEIHIDAAGNLQRVPWVAKSVADVTLTDSGRFGGSLSVSRPPLRDMITAVEIDFDFRFDRLWHREISVRFVTDGLCSYLNNGWTLPQKSTIAAAADGTSWTRTSAITWDELPGPAAAICTPPRAWGGGPSTLCLGARWKLAKRWTQTVTEQYHFVVEAERLTDTLGRRKTDYSYGVQATSTREDWEQMDEYNGPETGSTLLSGSSDYQIEDDGNEYDGREAFEDAAICSLHRARTILLRRARAWRVSVECPWRPDITLSSTVLVDTPGLTAKGKCYSVRETLNTETGETSMALTLALSRQEGNASDTPLTLPPSGTPGGGLPGGGEESGDGISPSSVLSLPQWTGGKSYITDDPSWSGWVTNVTAALQVPGAPIYDERFVVTMPEVESAARDEDVVDVEATYIVSIPNDTLTMRY